MFMHGSRRSGSRLGGQRDQPEPRPDGIAPLTWAASGTVSGVGSRRPLDVHSATPVQGVTGSPTAVARMRSALRTGPRAGTGADGSCTVSTSDRGTGGTRAGLEDTCLMCELEAAGRARGARGWRSVLRRSPRSSRRPARSSAQSPGAVERPPAQTWPFSSWWSEALL